MDSDSSSDFVGSGYPRTGGAFLAVLGGGFLYWMVWMPIEQAHQHGAHIHLYLKGTIAGTLLICVGLLKLAFGPRIRPILKPEGDESKIPVIVIGIILLAAGFGAHHALQTYLETQGYVF